MKSYNRLGINREFMKEYDGIAGGIQEQWKRNKQINNTIVGKWKSKWRIIDNINSLIWIFILRFRVMIKKNLQIFKLL